VNNNEYTIEGSGTPRGILVSLENQEAL